MKWRILIFMFFVSLAIYSQPHYDVNTYGEIKMVKESVGIFDGPQLLYPGTEVYIYQLPSSYTPNIRPYDLRVYNQLNNQELIRFQYYTDQLINSYIMQYGRD